MDNISLSPFRCRMWDFHDRLDMHVNEETCKCEIESFERHGQLIPVLGRRLRADATHDIELIYGARRLFVAQFLNKPLLVKICDVTDKEAIIAMDIENRQRRSVSPYEQGLAYAEWLRAKHFDSQDDLAKALRISSSQVSRLLKIARLPAVIINAFGSPLDVREGWGLDLSAALDDPIKKPALIEKARSVACKSARPVAAEVYRQLIASAVSGRPPKKPSHDEIVKGDGGAPLFRVHHQRNTIAVLLPVETASAFVMNDVKKALVEILQRHRVAASRYSAIGNAIEPHRALENGAERVVNTTRLSDCAGLA
jgi:ParB family transcriptional regulator, chromosome partitioning protein